MHWCIPVYQLLEPLPRLPKPAAALSPTTRPCAAICTGFAAQARCALHPAAGGWWAAIISDYNPKKAKHQLTCECVGALQAAVGATWRWPVLCIHASCNQECSFNLGLAALAILCMPSD